MSQEPVIIHYFMYSHESNKLTISFFRRIDDMEKEIATYFNGDDEISVDYIIGSKLTLEMTLTGTYETLKKQLLSKPNWFSKYKMEKGFQSIECVMGNRSVIHYF